MQYIFEYLLCSRESSWAAGWGVCVPHTSELSGKTFLLILRELFGYLIMTTLVSGKWTIQVALAFPFSFGWLFQRLSKCHLAKTFESSSSRFVPSNMDGWWTLAGIEMRMLVVHLFYYDVSS